MKHFFKGSHLPWIVVLDILLTVILVLNPLGLQGIPYDPSRDTLPRRVSTVTVPGYLEPPSWNGYPFQFWKLGGQYPAAGNHSYYYYDYGLLIIDGLFWLAIVTTGILLLDATLARVMEKRGFSHRPVR